MRQRLQAKQKGVVGTNIYSFWPYPLSRSCADIDAVQRVLDFTIGWILDPLVYGDYPEIMKKQAGSRIPSFTKEQSELIRGSADFIGINHYRSLYVSDGSNREKAGLRDYNADMATHFRVSRNDTPSDKYAPSKTLSDPKGLQCMLEYLKDTYEGIPVYVQENGFGQFDKEDSLNDTERVEYLSSYMGGTLAALRNGANVKGYFVWSFLDVFELFAGYHSPFGLHHVDFEDPSLPRQPKLSAQWYSKFLRSEIGIDIEKMISPDEHEHAYYQ